MCITRLSLTVCLILVTAGSCHALNLNPLPQATHFDMADGSSPGSVIKNFYVWYIRAIDAGMDPFINDRKTLLKFVTLRFVKQIERSESAGADADPFLGTQEWDRAWAETANVSNVRVKGSTGSAVVSFDAATDYPRVRITLVKVGSEWKIDRVRNDPPK